MKFVDTTVAYGAMSTTGSWTKISNPAQGTASNNRIGDRAYLVGLEGSLYLTNGGSNDMIRIIILQTKGLFTAAPALSDILVGTLPTSPYVYNARDLYEVVYDELFSSAPSSDSSSIVRRFMIKPKVHDQKYISGSSNVYNGQLYMLAFNTNTGNVSYTVSLRQWFEDSN